MGKKKLLTEVRDTRFSCIIVHHFQQTRTFDLAWAFFYLLFSPVHTHTHHYAVCR